MLYCAAGQVSHLQNNINGDLKVVSEPTSTHSIFHYYYVAYLKVGNTTMTPDSYTVQ